MAWQRGFLVVAFCHICKFHLCSALPACCWLTPTFSEQCCSPPWWLIYAQKRHLKKCIYTLNKRVYIVFPQILWYRHTAKCPLSQEAMTVDETNAPRCVRRGRLHKCEIDVLLWDLYAPFVGFSLILKLKHIRHNNLILTGSILISH